MIVLYTLTSVLVWQYTPPYLWMGIIIGSLGVISLFFLWGFAYFIGLVVCYREKERKKFQDLYINKILYPILRSYFLEVIRSPTEETTPEPVTTYKVAEEKHGSETTPEPEKKSSYEEPKKVDGLHSSCEKHHSEDKEEVKIMNIERPGKDDIQVLVISGDKISEVSKVLENKC